MTVPIFVPAGELIRLSCRRKRHWPKRTKRHWKYIEGGWDIERPAVMLNGKVQDGTRRLHAAAQNQPTMLVPVVEHRSFAEMQLRILGIKKACRTHEGELKKKSIPLGRQRRNYAPESPPPYHNESNHLRPNRQRSH